MPNEINNTNIAFGKYLTNDKFNFINQIDNDTVIIKPRFNTTGLQELKVRDILYVVDNILIQLFRWAFYYHLVKAMII